MSVAKRYKDCMVMIFKKKYNIDKTIAKQLIKEYNFDSIIKETHDFAMHDDPEEWVDIIYEHLKV